jgi:hypothetical protein
MANRSGYQPLSQSVEEADVGEGVQPSPSTRRLSRRLRAPRRGSIDLSKLDNAFKRQAPSEQLRVSKQLMTRIIRDLHLQMDGVHRTESKAKKEGRGQF